MAARALPPLALIVFVLAVCVGHPLGDDAWWALATGQWIWTHGQVPLTDPFSYGYPGATWVNLQWLGNTLLNLSYAAAGPGGALLLRVLLLVFVVLALWKLRPQGPASTPFLVLLVALIAMSSRFYDRAHLLSWAGLAATLWCLKRAEAERRWLLGPVLAAPLWFNLHGAAPLGAILIGAAALDRFGRRDSGVAWLLASGLFGLAVFATPFGASALGHLIDHGGGGTPIGEFIVEWQPLWRSRFWDLYPAATLLLAALWAADIWGRRHERPVGDALLWLTLGWLAANHIRFLAVFSLVAAGRLLASGVVLAKLPRLPAAPVAGALLALFVLRTATWGQWQPFALEDPDRLPDAAFTLIDQPDARVFTTHWRSASYLMHRAEGRVRVFQDGRTPAYYPYEATQRWKAASFDGDLSVLDAHAESTTAILIDGGMLASTRGALLPALDARSDYQLCFIDDLSALYLRECPQAYRAFTPRRLAEVIAGAPPDSAFLQELARAVESSPRTRLLAQVLTSLRASAGSN